MADTMVPEPLFDSLGYSPKQVESPARPRTNVIGFMGTALLRPNASLHERPSIETASIAATAGAPPAPINAQQGPERRSAFASVRPWR